MTQLTDRGLDIIDYHVRTDGLRGFRAAARPGHALSWEGRPVPEGAEESTAPDEPAVGQPMEPAPPKRCRRRGPAKADTENDAAEEASDDAAEDAAAEEQEDQA